MLADAARRQLHDVANCLFHDILANLAGIVQVDIDGDGLGDADRVGKLDRAAVGKSGGLNNDLADPASVFLYRGEPRDVAAKLGIDVNNFKTPLVPVIYAVNFRDPSGYFLATKMQIRNKDVLYVSNAQGVEVAKFMSYLRLINATVNDPLVTATNAQVLRSVR